MGGHTTSMKSKKGNKKIIESKVVTMFDDDMTLVTTLGIMTQQGLALIFFKGKKI